MIFGSISFYKRMLSIALPVMAQLFIQNLVALIDNFMVAGLGDIKMSGVNVAGQINFIILVLVNGVLCAGGGIFMSQYKGAGDKGGMRHVFSYKLIATLVPAIAFTLFCITNPAPVLALMVRGNAAAQEIVAQAATYERVLAWTWIPFAVSVSISSSLRETGEVRVPLIISVAATFVNTIGNYIFIYGHFGAPRLEVTGAAIATIIARTAEMVAFIVYIAVKKPDFVGNVRDILSVQQKLAFTILAKSAMIAISEMSWVLSETVAAALYNSRGGAAIVSGMAAGFTIANLFFASLSGIYTATGVVMGMTLGAGKLDSVREQKTWITNGAFVFGIFVMLLGFASTLFIPLVFANLSSAARAISRNVVLAMAAYMPLWCLLNAQFSISRTGGDTAMGAVVELTVTLLIFIPCMFVLTCFTTLGPVAMYAVAKLSDFGKAAVASLWLRKEKWLHNLAAENAVST